MKPLMALALLSCLMAPSLLAQTYNVTIVVEAGPDSEQTRMYYRRFADDNSHLLWMKSDGNATYKKKFDDINCERGAAVFNPNQREDVYCRKNSDG